MSLYCFHTVQDGVVLDRAGVELAGLGEASRYATRYAGDIMRLEPCDVFGRAIGVMVTDGEGLPLFTIAMVGTAMQGSA